MNHHVKQLQRRLKRPLLVSKKENLLYLTGRSFIDGYLLVFPKKAPVYLGNGLEVFKGMRSDYIFRVDKYIKSGFLQVEDVLSLKELKFLRKKLPTVTVKPVNDLVETAREIKSADELAYMEQAYRITALVFANIKRLLKQKQWTEQGLAQYIRIWGLEYGADDVSFEPIVAAGSNAAIPHHKPTDRVIKKGQSIVVDFGFKVKGYCSDFTRTVFLQRAPQQLAKIYNQAEVAYQKAFFGIRAGMAGAQADSLARDYLKVSKLDKYFIHSLGHGTGLEVHEAPSLSPRSKDILQNGMVFSIEPGIYLPRVGGVRIEDLVYLKSGQPRYFVEVSTKLHDNII